MTIANANKNVENDKIEHAFQHLMYQFRQINNKYGIMVSEQIDKLYEDRMGKMDECKNFIVQMKVE